MNYVRIAVSKTSGSASMARIPFLAEVSIGHGLTADCLTFGMAETVRRYVEACGGRPAH